MGLETCERLVCERQDRGLRKRRGKGWAGSGAEGEEETRREAGGAQYKRHQAEGAPATPSHFWKAGATAISGGRETRGAAAVI